MVRLTEMLIYGALVGWYSPAMEHTYQVMQPTDLQVVVADILAYATAGRKSVVITLQGELGAGKTTFTQELGRALGVTEPITSPTFTIMKRYELEQEDFDHLVHIDAYRFETEEEAVPLRLGEVFAIPRTIVCLEWPEQIKNLLPKDVVVVRISILEGEVRQVLVAYPESGRTT